MIYTWEIVKFDTLNQVNGDGATLSDSVVKIQWVKTGTENGKSASVVGFLNLTAAAVSAADFVSFSDLSEATVIGWLEAGISTDLMNSYNAAIQEKIDGRGTTERQIPWS